MTDSTIKLLRDLVAIDSVNPSLVEGGAGEKEIASRIIDEMRSFGMDAEMMEVAPGRFNAVGVLDGRSAGRSLMMCGHIDTVGVAGMKAPFDPAERDGRIYGRGSQDMKGGVAAMIAAAREIALSGGLEAGQIIIAAVADEEYKSIGAEALVKKWKADAAIITEPTDLIIGIGHRGFSWVEIETLGVAAHGSRPREGRDAILRMGRVLGRLESLDRHLQSRPAHPLLGTGSLHASLISGGREMSTYPDRCTLHLERRTVVGESETIALEEAEAIIAALKKEDEEFEASATLLFDRRPYETPAEDDLPRELEGAMNRIGRVTKREGMTFWTDAAVLGEAGIPSVIFGPGGEGLHSIEEYVRADEVLLCRDALVEMARAYCA